MPVAGLCGSSSLQRRLAKAIEFKTANGTPRFLMACMNFPSTMRLHFTMRTNSVIVDPDTGEVLASERARIAELEISEVKKNVSKARLIGDLEIKLEVGDEVEPQAGKIIVGKINLRQSRQLLFG